MQLNTLLILIGSTLALSFAAWARQWLFAIAIAFSGAYTFFDKVFPTVLPQVIVSSFLYIFLALVVFQLLRLFSDRKRPVSKN